MDHRIPVTLLTGFLGAGKTTLLNHVLRDPGMTRAAVLINEFGEVGVDHHLVRHVDDQVVVLDSGCLCCSVRGELARALRELFLRALAREIPPIDRVLVETTGLADPAPVIHTLMAEPFIADRYRCDGVITAVDVTHATGQFAAHREAVRQVAVADRLLLTKCDLAAEADIQAVAAQLGQINPTAPQLRVARGEVAADALFGAGVYDPAGRTPDVARWLAAEAVRAAGRQSGRLRYGGAAPRHDEAVTSFVLTFDEPLDWFDFGEALRTLQTTCGERLLRVKGLLNVAGDALPRVVQAVQHVTYPPASLPAWPEEPPYSDRKSRLVFIVRDLERSLVEQAFAMFCGVKDVPEA